mmetsp:Transcript_5070/g.7355  ORF Transcript_5070/g.7355 Transcript_5070/m.7355 type:complete len:130 (+) Transcript_5070:55-444(+)
MNCFEYSSFSIDPKSGKSRNTKLGFYSPVSKCTSGKRWQQIRALMMNAFILLGMMKFIKPDFSLRQTHLHDQSRFLRGNNILMDSSPFTPRFVQDTYHPFNEDLIGPRLDNNNGQALSSEYLARVEQEQ